MKYGSVALGFAMMENVAYYMRAFNSGGAHQLELVFILCSVLAPFGHPLFTSMTGLGVAYAAMNRGAGRLLFTDKDAGSHSKATQRCENGVLVVEGELAVVQPFEAGHAEGRADQHGRHVGDSREVEGPPAGAQARQRQDGERR